ncbi:MAG: sensor histidine kinase [Mycobacteriales bacterium]
MRLRQAVRNLLDNALRYGEGTPVVVTGERREDGVAITVADGGPGFPAQVLQRALEPFTRASPNGSDAPKHGAGLGLAIVRAVAEAHGGHAEASNPSTGGARVDIMIRG